MQVHPPESLVIRPPSEWQSMLVRIARGCAWNRCRFCGIYPSMGHPDFSKRTVEEVKQDIDSLRARLPRVKTAFLGDADPLGIPLDDLISILKYLRKVFPELGRVTCYARCSSIWKKGSDAVEALAEAGLTRMHIGLESGDAEVLRFHRKGQSPRILLETGKWLKKAGIQISYYVLLGLGGVGRWKEHIDETAKIINAVNPEFVRLRRIWLYRKGEQGALQECPLWEEINNGSFVPQTPEGTVKETRRLVAGMLGVHTRVVSDHANNYLQIEGDLPDDRARMLGEIDEFLNLPEEDRQQHYEAVGSRI